MSAVEYLTFADCFEDISRGVGKIKQKDYLLQGDHPVIDQGQDVVAGYGNGEEGLCTNVPAIVFGDHTRCVKYVARPFFAGADGVKILKPRNNHNTRYWFHSLRSKHIENLGYSRHYKLLKECGFRKHTYKEQDQISARLDRILELINTEMDSVEKLDELVKSRFIEMFGDPQENPKDLPIKRIDEIADVQTGATPLRSNPDYYGGAIPWIKTGEVASGLAGDAEETITELALKETNCKLFPAGTILIAMYGQGDTRGKAAILKQEAATNQACAAVLLHDDCDPDFILAQLNLRYRDLRSLSLGGNQKNLSLKIIKGYHLVIPDEGRQREFMSFKRRVDKSAFISRKGFLPCGSK